MTATSSPWPQSQGSRFAWSPARIDHAVHATCTGRDAVSARSPRENAGSSRTRTNPPQGRRPADRGAADAERTHPPLRAPRQAERDRPAVGMARRNPAGRHRAAGTRPALYQLVYTNLMIGLDHVAPGISTDSARGPETTGNNWDDSDKHHTRRGRPTHQWNGPPPQVNDRYIRRSGLPYVQSSHSPPDDHPLNFARALKNREDLRVPVPALHRVLAGVPVAAEDLDRLLGDPDRRLPRDELGYRALGALERLAGPRHRGPPPGQQPRRVHGRGHVGELERHALVLPDRPPELRPRPRVLRRELGGGTRDPDGHRRDRGPGRLERLHRRPLPAVPPPPPPRRARPRGSGPGNGRASPCRRPTRRSSLPSSRYMAGTHQVYGTSMHPEAGHNGRSEERRV